MTIIDKARLRESVYELAENDDSRQYLTAKSNRLEKQVSDFLEGLTSIYFNKEKNRLVWHNKDSSENSTDVAIYLSDIAGHLSQDLKLVDEAISIAKLSVRLNSSDGISHVNLGHLYLDKGWFDKAIAKYEEAKRLDPDLVYAYEGLGNAYAKMGQFEKALPYFEKNRCP
jgi:tetratricopeptide (TPR) repeat protein